jgi:hypothetical protein
VLKEDKRAIFNATPEPQPDIERSQREMEESITY